MGKRRRTYNRGIKADSPANGLSILGCAQEPEELLNGWSNNISKLLELVDKSCQQIQKECMVHKLALSSAN